MPKWITARPPDQCQESEIRFASHLAAQLGDEYIVRWGYYYQDGSDKRYAKTREGDFLILGPHGGVCVCEVKTSIYVSAKDGDWGEGADSPLMQLLAQHAGVLRKFQQRFQAYSIPYIQKVLVCPNIEIDRSVSEFHTIPTDLIWDKKDCENLLGAWERVFGRNAPMVIEDQREAFELLFASDIRPEKQRYYKDYNEERILRQTMGMQRWLQALSNNRQLLVQGGVGSGKTFMAMYAARMAANQQVEGRHQKVLVVVYNLALGSFLKQELRLKPGQRGRVEVYTFESLCEAILKSAGMASESLREGLDASTYFEQVLPAKVNELLATHEGVKGQWLGAFDQLVVDEAQDHNTELPALREELPLGYWSLYAKLLKDGFDAKMFITGDPHQRPPFREDGVFCLDRLRSVLSQSVHLHLSETKRYTRQIATFLRGLRGEGSERLAYEVYLDDQMPDGPKVHEDSVARHEVVAALEKLLSCWHKEGLCKYEDVLILYERGSLQQSVIGDLQRLAKHPLKPYIDSISSKHEPSIPHSSVHKAKGIDSCAVILVGMPYHSSLERPMDRYTYFMGASRARQVLACLHVED